MIDPNHSKLFTIHSGVRTSSLRKVFILFLSYPLNSLTVFPLSKFDDIVSILVNAYSLLLSVEPRAVVLATVRPSEYSVALLLVIKVFP